MHGGPGNDRISPSRDADKLFGDAGEDLIKGGGDDDDRLVGQGGFDNIDRGSGTDECRQGEVHTSCEVIK